MSAQPKRRVAPRLEAVVMTKKPYVLALLVYTLIPIIMVSGMYVAAAINPESAALHPNYARNFQLLMMAQIAIRLATLGTLIVLWFLTCFLLVKSKARTLSWLLLALLGPFGIVALMILNDRSAAPQDRYQRFVRNLKIYFRVPYEALLFFAVWTLAFQLVEIAHDLMTRYESVTTGVPLATIIETQTASSGMWAFGELLEALYVVTLVYLWWPVCFNLLARIFGRNRLAAQA
jgi:hypothetical protein